MKYALIGLLLASSAAFAQDKLMGVGMEMTDKTSMSAIQLREGSCGGGTEEQAIKNLRFNSCVMFVLGAVEMLREWQRAGGPKVCAPRNIRAGDLIIAVQQYIEEKQAWRNNTDATTVIVDALKARWPC
jgi:hypothetical protein